MAIKVSGIDVSHWQGNIDWGKVSGAGIKFAIIKAGGSDNGFYTDSKWETNYKGARAAGLDVGAYYFNGKNCTSWDDGRADAQRFLKLLAGKKFEYPVYFDCEAQLTSTRTGNTDAVIGFCKELEAAKYYAGVYASTSSGFQSRLDDSRLKEYTHWVAQYASTCKYTGTIGIWQYSSTGKVNGISGNVDMDFAYVDFPAAMAANHLNGY